MGKNSPKEGDSKIPKHRKRSGSSSNKYLKPGALAQIRYSKVSGAKGCTDLGKKRIAVVDITKTDDETTPDKKVVDESPQLLSPERFKLSSVVGCVEFPTHDNLLRTPKTPCVKDTVSDLESRLESLPIEILVNILCMLHHDQLKVVFHVSRRIRSAALFAKQYHFNYTTPDRSRQEMLRTMTPLPTQHWPFVSKNHGKGLKIVGPHTPRAPKHGPRPPSRFKQTDLKQIAASLFQDPALSSCSLLPSVLPKPIIKSLASHRVLFYEDELCQAVAQNKLH